MKRKSNLILLGGALICAMSCAKVNETDIDKLSPAAKSKSETYPGATLQASSVVGYWKDSVTTVTMIDCNPGYTKYIMYSVGPMSVKAGDVVSAHFQQQFGQTGNPPIMTATGIVVSTSAPAISGNMIAGWAGSNLSQQEGGREVVSRTGSYQFTADAENVYINAVAYGQALITGGGSGDLTIPAGRYGELVAVLERGISWHKTKVSNLPYNSTEGKNYIPSSPVLNIHNSIGPLNIPANSMVDVRFDIEATSEVPTGNYNQRLGRNIVQNTSAAATGGTYLSKQIQGGIIKGEHHYVVSHVAGRAYPDSTSGAYFKSIVYSYGNWSTEKLYVEPGTASSYGQMIVEVRPNADFYEDPDKNFSTVTSTQKVLYTVGPMDLEANQVVEVRYQAAFSPSAALTIDSKIVLANSATATNGINVQKVLARGFHPYYVYNNMVQTTAYQNGPERVTGKYFNVVVFKIAGADCPVLDWGELEAVKR